MMIKLVAIFLLSVSLNAQNIYKECLVVSAPMVIAGASDAFTEVLQHDYVSFKRHFPSANDQYWDYHQSWTNKWKKDNDGNLIRPLKERFIGSSSVFVNTTDGYHMLRSVQKTAYIATVYISLSQPKRNWKQTLLKTAVVAVGYYGSFNLTYNYLRSKK